VKPRLRGKAFEIRYADDAVICFQYREDAEKVLQVLAKRFERFGLTLHPEKTRLVAFGASGPGESDPDEDQNRNFRLPRLQCAAETQRKEGGVR
jgi:RNA-directed DNA polymerase